MHSNFEFSNNAGQLAGENRDFTIYGQNHSVDGNGKFGIEVTEGQTLSVNEVDSFKNFNQAIYNNGGTVNLSSNFTDNSGSNGSVVFNNGNLNITDSAITDNSATGYGGAICVVTSGDKVTNITNSTVAENDAYLGGALFLQSGELNIKNSEFTDNTL